MANSHLKVAITAFGARLAAIQTRDRAGDFGHVLLGFDDPAVYRTAIGAFGAVLGRCANRIADARFSLDGKTYVLDANDNGNTLHGGQGGFGNLPWTVESFTQGETPALSLVLTSPNGDQGFPGTVTARVTYQLRAEDLVLTLSATTDAPTVINLSSHPYFNLCGPGCDISDHLVTLYADHFLPTDGQQIPTGEIRSVEHTGFDFRAPVALGERLWLTDPQLLIACGFDHCFVLRQHAAPAPRLAARVFAPPTGRRLEVYTTQPGLQFYTGNNLTGALAGHGGAALRQSSGLALEAQNFPNAVNQHNFPSPVLRPGAAYRQTILYRFSCGEEGS